MAEILLLTATMLAVRPHPSFFIIMIISNQVSHFENLTKAEKQRGGQGKKRRGGKLPWKLMEGMVSISFQASLSPYLCSGLSLAAP